MGTAFKKQPSTSCNIKGSLNYLVFHNSAHPCDSVTVHLIEKFSKVLLNLNIPMGGTCSILLTWLQRFGYSSSARLTLSNVYNRYALDEIVNYPYCAHSASCVCVLFLKSLNCTSAGQTPSILFLLPREIDI